MHLKSFFVKERSQLLKMAQRRTAGRIVGACLMQRAIDIARHQQARSLELRAITSLAVMWQAQGRSDEARQT